MEDKKYFIISEGDFYNAEEIKKILLEKKPGRIIFDLSSYETINSSFLGIVVIILRENEEQKINAEILYKNPNQFVEKILARVKLLDFGEVIHE